MVTPEVLTQPPVSTRHFLYHLCYFVLSLFSPALRDLRKNSVTTCLFHNQAEKLQTLDIARGHTSFISGSGYAMVQLSVCNSQAVFFFYLAIEWLIIE